jgi:hypothetical protein
LSGYKAVINRPDAALSVVILAEQTDSFGGMKTRLKGG